MGQRGHGRWATEQFFFRLEYRPVDLKYECSPVGLGHCDRWDIRVAHEMRNELAASRR